MTEIPFNMNWNIKVKLNAEGFKHWKKVDDEIFNKAPSLADKYVKSLDYYKAKQDSDGYVKMPMWEFMQYFGETIVFGTQPKFDTNIVLLKPEKTQKAARG